MLDVLLLTRHTVRQEIPTKENRDMGEKKGYQEVDLATLMQEPDAFSAWGFARIKVQRGDITRVVKIKITSVPQDVVDKLQDAAPKPPLIDIMLDPTNPDHAALGITTRQKGRVPNYGDPDFQKMLREHTSSVTRQVVGLGVHPDEKLLTPDGDHASTPDERFDALERMKLAAAHFADIATAIMRLTSFTEEERQNFF